MEIKSNHSLPFLNVLVSHLPNGSLTHQVYHKKTHTDKYLHAISHHHPSQKFVFLKTLVTLAIWISYSQSFPIEKTPLTKALKVINCTASYIKNAFRYVLHPHPNPKNSTINPPLAQVTLPYIQGITNHIFKILSKRNIKTLFKPQTTLSQLF